MYCFTTFLVALAVLSTGDATKAADAELYQTMLDRSASPMDRSAASPEDRALGAVGDGCDEATPCSEGLTCIESACAAEKKTECPAGWIPLSNTCGETADLLCVTLGAPLKYVSWLHMQYQCDAIGGYLPEPTADNKVNLELILSSMDALYAKDAPILMYLGATDVTRANEWKWLKSATELADKDQNANWKDNTAPNADDNKDCLAQQSSDKLWTNVNCENDSMPNQIANICFGSPATAKALPVA